MRHERSVLQSCGNQITELFEPLHRAWIPLTVGFLAGLLPPVQAVLR